MNQDQKARALGIDPGATKQQARSAFAKLSKEYPPHDPDTVETFRKLKEAYETWGQDTAQGHGGPQDFVREAEVEVARARVQIAIQTINRATDQDQLNTAYQEYVEYRDALGGLFDFPMFTNAWFAGLVELGRHDSHAEECYERAQEISEELWAQSEGVVRSTFGLILSYVFVIGLGYVALFVCPFPIIQWGLMLLALWIAVNNLISILKLSAYRKGFRRFSKILRHLRA